MKRIVSFSLFQNKGSFLVGTDSKDYRVEVIFLTESVNIVHFLSKVELSAVLLSQVYVLLNLFSRDTEARNNVRYYTAGYRVFIVNMYFYACSCQEESGRDTSRSCSDNTDLLLHGTFLL